MATTNFINVEAKNPKNEPNAAFTALLNVLLLMSSPIRAPKKGPIIIPPGMGERSPTTNPIEVPIIPALLPPNRLVPIAGIK